MSSNRMDAEERRMAIVSSVLPLFARKGFANTTTRELADTAKVSEALLYKHFPSKESLFSEIQEFCCTLTDPGLTRLSAMEPSTATLVHITYYLVRTILIGSARDEIGWETRHRLLLNSCLADGNFARSLFQKRFDCCMPGIQASLEAAEQAGDIVPTPVSRETRIWFAHHVAAMVATMHLPSRAVLDYHSTREELLEHCVWFALRGMGMTDNAINQHYHPKSLSLFFSLDMK